MAVGLVLNGSSNSMMAHNNNNISNSYDRSRFTLNLPIAASHLMSHSSSPPSESATNRLRHWNMSPTSPSDSSPFEVRNFFAVHQTRSLVYI